MPALNKIFSNTLLLLACMLATILNASGQLQKTYFSEGPLYEVGYLKNGERDGEWKKYYKNNVLHIIGKYESGKKTGLWKHYEINGSIQFTENFVNGVLHGESLFYHPNGQLRQNMTFNSGTLVGISKTYSETGRILTIDNFDNGDFQKFYQPSGKIAETGKKSSQGSVYKTGVWKEFYESGKLSGTGTYENGDKVGEWKTYFKNGKLSSTGSYDTDPLDKGTPIGEWKYYYSNGQLMATGQYSKSQPVAGTWKTYNEQGQSAGCNCPVPTRDQLYYLAYSIESQDKASKDVPSSAKKDIFYEFDELLWLMSCAQPGVDSMEDAKKKIQCMWNQHRQQFKYDGGTSTSNHSKQLNIVKFAVEKRFSAFISQIINKYQLDLNFIDPKDGKTVLDFAEDLAAYYRKREGMEYMADEYQSTANYLVNKGAKRAQEIGK